jgi:hypothetical protein
LITGALWPSIKIVHSDAKQPRSIRKSSGNERYFCTAV